VITNVQILKARDAAEWMRTLDRCASYDFYHLPQYHALAEEADGIGAYLFCGSEAEHVIALPLVLRSLESETGFEMSQWTDATSVYGYVGPVSSDTNIPETVIADFQAALREWLEELHVVSVFSRLHPFAPQRRLLAGLGECEAIGHTVSIDLSVPPQIQRSRFRRSHREAANRLRRLGVTCEHDPDGAYQDDFVRIYYQNMRRVGAGASYYFPPEYFEKLRRALGSRLHCFACRHLGEVLCGGLFVTCQGNVQYHLGATRDDALKVAPMKLLLDEVRLWATARGERRFHLGGGATSDPEDSLLYFKKGFAGDIHEFCVWRWILQPEIYEQFCNEKRRRNERQAVRSVSDRYFPAYRCPTVPCAGTAVASVAVTVDMG
jgi:Acetyltransferase (GNAT) domain